MTAATRRRLDVRLVGRFTVVVDGRPIEGERWRHASAARLVKLLLVSPAHRLSRESAAEHLWPDGDPVHQAANLRKAVHFARRALGDDDDQPILVTDRGQLAFDPDLDLHVDLDHLATADTDALILLGKEPLLPDDPYEEWLAAPRERLTIQWTDAATQRARDALEGGDHDAAGALIDALLTRDPTDEEAHRLAIASLGAQGRHHAARRQFFRCRRELRAAYGVEPSQATIDAIGRAVAIPASDPGPVARIVGRHQELSRFDDLLERVDQGPLSLVVRGEAGVGKSRLIAEMTAYVRASGWRVLDARCREAVEELPFEPLRGAFQGLTPDDVAGWPEPAASAIAMLAPDLGGNAVIPFASAHAVAAAVSSAVELLSARRPLAIAIDDAHWLDAATGRLLGRVMASSRILPCLLILGLRTDEPVTPTTTSLLETLGHGPGDEFALARLPRETIGPIVAARLGGASLDPAVVDFLFERSQGNPLFALELARSARDEGRIALRAGTWRMTGRADTATAPSTVVRLVRHRSAHVGIAALRVLELMTEFGEPVGFEAIVRAAGASPEAVGDALEEAIQSGLLAEDAAGYRFAHPLFRAAVVQLIPPVRRPAIALTVARAMASDVDPYDTRAVDELITMGADPAAIADRALRATEAGIADAAALAVTFGFRAGTRLAMLLERETARALLERSVAVWSSLPDDRRNDLRAIGPLVALGNLRMADKDDDGARAAYRLAIEYGRTAEELGSAYLALAMLPYRHADYGTAIAYLREGLARAGGDELLSAILQVEIGWLEFRRQHLDASLRLLQDAMAVLERLGADASIMRALDMIWGPLEGLGRGAESLPGLRRALRLAEKLRDVQMETRIRSHLGFRFVIAGTPEEARPHVERSQSLGRMMGDAYSEAIATWAAAEMQLALGDLDAAAEAIETELALFASIGGNPRHEAIAHAQWSHVAHLAGDATKAGEEATLARAAAAKAAIGDRAFAQRIEGYLLAPRWVPNSM